MRGPRTRRRATLGRALARRAPAALALIAALVLGGCGASREDLLVSAAASLKSSFNSYAHDFNDATVRYSFAGSDQLAAQIQHGARPDVFASANLKLPQQLFAAGLVERPVAFASNRLVLAVPNNSSVRGLQDLQRGSLTIAVGSPTVPIGAYTRNVLARLGAGPEGAILARVRTQEPDVAGIVGKLATGAVDAGFLYATDVEATRGRLRAIALPASLQPQVAYGIAVVRGAPHPTQARAFIAGLLAPPGQADLARAGFGSPPGR